MQDFNTEDNESKSTHIRTPLYTNNELSILRRFQKSNVLMPGNQLTSFANVKIRSNCSNIDLSQNYLEDFTGIPESIPDLTVLNLDNNQIRSFFGIPSSNPFPKLHWISLKGNPIGNNKFLKIMCLVCFGNQLKTINGEKIRETFRKSADELRPSLLPELLQGRILTSLNPVRLIDMTSSSKLQRSHVQPPEELINTAKVIKFQATGAFDKFDLYSIDNEDFDSSNQRNANRSQEQKPSIGCLIDAFNGISSMTIDRQIESCLAYEEENDEELPFLQAIENIKYGIQRLKNKYSYADSNQHLTNTETQGNDEYSYSDDEADNESTNESNGVDVESEYENGSDSSQGNENKENQIEEEESDDESPVDITQPQVEVKQEENPNEEEAVPEVNQNEEVDSQVKEDANQNEFNPTEEEDVHEGKELNNQLIQNDNNPVEENISNKNEEQKNDINSTEEEIIPETTNVENNGNQNEPKSNENSPIDSTESNDKLPQDTKDDNIEAPIINQDENEHIKQETNITEDQVVNENQQQLQNVVNDHESNSEKVNQEVNVDQESNQEEHKAEDDIETTSKEK